MSKYLGSTSLAYLIGLIKSAFIAKTDTTTVQSVDVDSTPTANSTNLVTSGGVYSVIGNIETLLAAI